MGFAWVLATLDEASDIALATYQWEMQLNAPATDWTDVSRDVRTIPAPTWARGMRGGTPVDRVAGVGVLNVALNNFPYSLPSYTGYYTPGHSRQRAGFKLGVGFRLRVNYAELSAVLFSGTVEAVLVEPGEARSRHVDLVVVDWMEEAATSQVEGVDTLTNVRSDEAFSAIIDAMPRQPVAVQTDVGMDTYAYAVDTARQEEATAQSEFVKLAMSELGYIYVKADGTLVFEGRRKRGSESSLNVFTFDMPMFNDVSVTRSRTDIINKVKVISHPRRVDASPVVLYRLVQAVQIGAGGTVRLFGGYSDPEQRGRRTGGFDFINPLADGVDYIANSAGDGSGVDLTSAIAVTASTTGNGVSFQVTNTGSSAAWITTLQIRGRGIYDFEHAVMESEDADSILQFGRRTRTIDMPYQSDALVAASAAQYLISLYADDISAAESLTYLANESNQLMRQALLREISDRIGIRESVTALTDTLSGTTATRGWFINGVRGDIVEGRYLRMTYLLAPADRNTYWLLGVSGSSELNITTRLGYGIFQGHVDVDHLDQHGDNDPHLDSPFSDSHGDVQHADGGHLDQSHGDSPYQDSPHQDVATVNTHGDVQHLDDPHIDSTSNSQHADSHGDVPYQDSPHGDSSHVDVPHIDDSHQDHDDLGSAEQHHDSPFSDSPHSDSPHADGHGDSPFSDQHSDVQHGDSHNDEAHEDVPGVSQHGDTPHSDVGRVDQLHVDSGHGDAGHADVTAVNTHSDVDHVDNSPHEDIHGDRNHGDSFG
jgi:hypothetical protein